MTKHRRVEYVYALLWILILFLILLIIFYPYPSLETQYPPFATMPEIQLSQQPRFFIPKLIHETVQQSTNGLQEQDQPMILGHYDVYPLNKPRNKDSVVAVTPGIQDFPFYTSWGIEVNIDTWNFVWDDSNSSYWVTPVLVQASPIVVLKGEFPYARYFSVYSYIGPEKGLDGTSYFGQASTWDFSGKCNASIPGNCAGLRDFEIEPDVGSKNPYRDSTYEYGQDKFFTIYLVSPYYQGELPKSKNILPLTIYGSKIALILYRIYGPFNPKFCGSGLWWPGVPYNTKGCKDVSDPRSIPTRKGGAAYPYLDKSNPVCKTGDVVCINKCVTNKLVYTAPECAKQSYQNNRYCVCEHPEDPCYSKLDSIIKDCSNDAASIQNFCAKKPQQSLPYCVSDILPEEDPTCPKITIHTNCPVTDPVCNYKVESLRQACVAQKLIDSTNPDCYHYKDPSRICELIRFDESGKKQPANVLSPKPGTCAADFQQFIYDCSPYNPVDNPGVYKLKASQLCGDRKDPPNYNYDPMFDFSIPPKGCTGYASYQCKNGYCVPSQDGKQKESCENPRCSIPPSFDCRQDQCLEKDGGDFPSSQKCQQTCGSTGSPCLSQCIAQCYLKDRAQIQDCLRECSVQCSKEMYQHPEFQLNQNTKCVFSENNCRGDPGNINFFGMNSLPAVNLVRQGWVDLPQCFLKYSYNNYFIRCNTWNFTSYNKISLLHYLKNYIRGLQNIMSMNLNLYDNLDVKDLLSRILSRGSGELDDDPLNLDWDSLVEEDDEKKHQILPDHTKDCDQWVDPSTYYKIGTQYPKGMIPILTFKNSKTYKSPSEPYCTFYGEKCQCANNAKTCCATTLGNLNCRGEPCFDQWSFQSVHESPFKGIAKPFVFSGDTGKVIPFPNPDISYLGCCTEYSEDEVYVVWMDLPTTPLTPGYENIRATKDYDLRYLSIGHYFFGMTLSNPRPVLSDLVDQDLETVSLSYVDDLTGETVENGRRVCIVLASNQQYEYMKSFDLLHKHVNWLNWGKTKSTMNLSADNLQTPEYGILLYRQLLPSESFQQGFSTFTQSDCIQKKISVSKTFPLDPVDAPKYCNPGNPVECAKQGYDPCCLCKDVLEHSKQFYPRCEKVKLCDIHFRGCSFWEKYLQLPLPYKSNHLLSPRTTPTPIPQKNKS